MASTASHRIVRRQATRRIDDGVQWISVLIKCSCGHVAEGTDAEATEAHSAHTR